MGLTTIMSKTAIIGIISEIVPRTDKTPKLSMFLWNQTVSITAGFVLVNLLIILVATAVLICIPKLWQFVSLTSTR